MSLNLSRTFFFLFSFCSCWFSLEWVCEWPYVSETLCFLLSGSLICVCTSYQGVHYSFGMIYLHDTFPGCSNLSRQIFFFFYSPHRKKHRPPQLGTESRTSFSLFYTAASRCKTKSSPHDVFLRLFNNSPPQRQKGVFVLTFWYLRRLRPFRKVVLDFNLHFWSILNNKCFQMLYYNQKKHCKHQGITI